MYITKLLLCHICCAVCYLHCILCLTFLQCIFICAEKYKAKNRDILWRLKKGWGQWMSDFLCVCQCFEFPSASLFTDIQSVNPAPLRQTFLDLMLEEHGGWPADRGLPEIQPLNLRCWFILTRACMKYGRYSEMVVYFHVHMTHILYSFCWRYSIIYVSLKLLWT